MNLIDIIEKDLIKVPLISTTKEAVIKELVDVLAAGKQLDQNQRASILEVVVNREALGSTAIGKGVCVPHAQSKEIDEITVVVGVSRVPIDFDSPDNLKSKIFFLVLAPTHSPSSHVDVLSSIARTCSSEIFRRLLLQCKSSDEILQLFSD